MKKFKKQNKTKRNETKRKKTKKQKSKKSKKQKVKSKKVKSEMQNFKKTKGRSCRSTHTHIPPPGPAGANVNNSEVSNVKINYQNYEVELIKIETTKEISEQEDLHPFNYP
eukprot:Pgem_evm1s7752